MTATTTLKLPEKLKTRIARLARETGRSAHSLMVEALEREVTRKERMREFVREALVSDAAVEEGATVYRAKDVHPWLVRLAKNTRAAIVTNDYNLNRVAELQGVTVLNLNELANALRAVFLPGEAIEVRVIQEGKEAGQGVGYLEDGTMVVVDEGRRHIDRTIPVVVTKVLQTTAGRMIFARVDSSVASGNAH